MKSRGHFVLALNAHLPFVRHPEHEYFLEESWYFEAAIETYIPLVGMLARLAEERVRFGMALSLSPTLISMMSDPLLGARLLRHMDRLIGLCKAELRRTAKMKAYAPLARRNLREITRVRRVYADDMNCDLVGALRALASKAPRLELITTAATHAFLPNLAPLPDAVLAQVTLGRECFLSGLGMEPRGIWLPECGYHDGVGRILRRAGYEYTILEAHALLHATPRPRFGAMRPVIVPGGVMAFARDSEFSDLVWSSKSGYPADPAYRDFHADLGYAQRLPAHVRRHLAALTIGNARAHTGIKYHAIAEDARGRKLPYDPALAASRAKLHAHHFVRALEARARSVCSNHGFAPVITAAYDAELFGHWWHEGVAWLEHVLRMLASGRIVRAHSPSACIKALLRDGERITKTRPGLSSWGRGGYGALWAEMDGGRALSSGLMAWRRLEALTSKQPLMSAEQSDALDQAAMELMLSLSSDWAFLARSGTAASYARARVSGHMDNFRRLERMIECGKVDMDALGLMRSRTGGLLARCDAAGAIRNPGASSRGTREGRSGTRPQRRKSRCSC